MINSAERALLQSRPTAVDPAGVEALHYLGNYQRDIPVNITRMMENAYDWEHLPFVHASSFATIDLVEEGRWGWRAKVRLPDAAGGGDQLLELLVDLPRDYWATTVVSGSGSGIEIHTQASETGPHAIAIDVRFYLPEAPENAGQGAMILSYLQAQYKTLYDEDEALMSGRQQALDARQAQRSEPEEPASNIAILVGDIAALDEGACHMVPTPKGPYIARQWQGRWTAHSATCPHLLGSLDQAPVEDDGFVTCPWHGYAFDMASGAERDGKCAKLAIAAVRENEGRLYLEL